MDLSKLRIEVYDFLALIIPGLLVVCEIWVALRGWNWVAATLPSFGGTGFTILLLLSFSVGSLAQEATDITIKRLKGKRFFKTARDKLWISATGDHVSSHIADQLGHEVENVDVAFDYCLTCVQNSFTKRDLFLASSDLARSMVVVCAFSVLPALRIILDLHKSRTFGGLSFAAVLLCIAVVSRVYWSRMVRFRELSETPVFHAYLAQAEQKPLATKEQKGE